MNENQWDLAQACRESARDIMDLLHQPILTGWIVPDQS